MKSMLPLSVLISGILLLGLGSCSQIEPGGDRPNPNPSTSIQASSESPSDAALVSPTAVSEVSTNSQANNQADTRLNYQADGQPANQTEAQTNSAATPEPVATVSATLYTADSECESFVSEEIQLPSDQPVTAAVSKVLQAQTSSDFDLSGFRVSVDKGVATVDLRLVPGSPRRITSLSTCEQFALFGGLRETLTRNTQWQIKSVRFLERGVAIAR
ncbi:sporulation/spore germination protein [Cyanobacteria bacterium FACHB-471]|nr:sporulation/spore germination protein [Cyanobacteria bacterium FACHB-471]